VPSSKPGSIARPATARQALGTFGETYAVHQLQRNGYEIVERNAHFSGGEIDIIARQGGELVFVEVKTRRQSVMAMPEDAIDEERMSHLETAIVQYLEPGGFRDQPYRIEVMAIDVNRAGRVTRCEIFGDVGLR
jgi:putative endonuclease